MKKFMMVAAFVALAALTCTSGRIIINGKEPLVANSPGAVLKILEYSFNTLDIFSLKSCLSENFVFYVDPEEFGRRGGALPSSMSYDEFWRTARHMFEEAYAVAMFIDVKSVGTPDPERPTYKAENIRLRLLVLVTENAGFLAEGHAGFEFEKYLNEANEDRWRLTKWWDGTLPEEGAVDPARPKASIERASVAAILAYFK